MLRTSSPTTAKITTTAKIKYHITNGERDEVMSSINTGLLLAIRDALLSTLSGKLLSTIAGDFAKRLAAKAAAGITPKEYTDMLSNELLVFKFINDLESFGIECEAEESVETEVVA